MFNLYLVENWHGTFHILSASKIHKEVTMNKNNNDWINSVKSLVEICDKKSFPKDKAIDIKIAILYEFFEQIEAGRNFSKDDAKKVYLAYNSLYELKEKKAIEARRNFIRAYLDSITYSSIMFKIHSDIFKENIDMWKNKKFNELFSLEYIDFNEVFNDLRQEFYTLIKTNDKMNDFNDETNNSINKQKILTRY